MQSNIKDVYIYCFIVVLTLGLVCSSYGGYFNFRYNQCPQNECRECVIATKEEFIASQGTIESWLKSNNTSNIDIPPEVLIDVILYTIPKRQEDVKITLINLKENKPKKYKSFIDKILRALPKENN